MEVDNDFLELGIQENDLIDDIEMSDGELDEDLERLNNIEKEKIKIKTETKTEFKAEEGAVNENDRKVGKPTDMEIKNNEKGPSSGQANGNREKPQRRNNNNDYGNIKVDKKRLFKPLYVDKNTDPAIVGREIAYRLQEKKTILIINVVRVIGTSMSVEVFNETKKIVRSGGLKTDDGERKRSPGGTYLYILKNRGYASNAQMKEIFKYEHERHREKRKHKAQRLRSNERKPTKAENHDQKPNIKVESFDEKPSLKVQDHDEKPSLKVQDHDEKLSLKVQDHDAKQNIKVEDVDF